MNIITGNAQIVRINKPGSENGFEAYAIAPMKDGANEVTALFRLVGGRSTGSVAPNLIQNKKIIGFRGSLIGASAYENKAAEGQATMYTVAVKEVWPAATVRTPDITVYDARTGRNSQQRHGLRYTPSGIAVMNVDIAEDVYNPYKQREDGDGTGETQTNWITVTLWRHNAEYAASNASFGEEPGAPGIIVHFSGKLNYKAPYWSNKHEEYRTGIEATADDFIMVKSRSSSNGELSDATPENVDLAFDNVEGNAGEEGFGDDWLKAFADQTGASLSIGDTGDAY